MPIHRSAASLAFGAPSTTTAAPRRGAGRCSSAADWRRRWWRWWRRRWTTASASASSVTAGRAAYCLQLGMQGVALGLQRLRPATCFAKGIEQRPQAHLHIEAGLRRVGSCCLACCLGWRCTGVGCAGGRRGVLRGAWCRGGSGPVGPRLIGRRRQRALAIWPQHLPTICDHLGHGSGAKPFGELALQSTHFALPAVRKVGPCHLRSKEETRPGSKVAVRRPVKRCSEGAYGYWARDPEQQDQEREGQRQFVVAARVERGPGQQQRAHGDAHKACDRQDSRSFPAGSTLYRLCRTGRVGRARERRADLWGLCEADAPEALHGVKEDGEGADQQ